MRIRIVTLLLLLFAFVEWQVCSARNWDVREPDTIRIGSILIEDYPWPDSIGLPLHIWADDTIAGLSLAFQPSNPLLHVSSFSSENSVFDEPGVVWTNTVIDSAENRIGFGCYNFQGIWQLNPVGLIGTLYFRVDPAMPGATAVDIDSTFIEPGIYCEIITVVSGYVHTVRPAPFTNDGGANAAFGDAFLCGDADSNGIVNISDAVYLIAYIFGGGPPPDPLLAGDADCNEIVNISDAVYLIAYIFGGGPAPCEGC